MKAWRFVFMLFLVLAACSQKEKTPPEEQTPEENPVPDPEFTVSGAPEGAVSAYSTFLLTVSSQSAGSIDYKSDKPSVASISLAARRQYKVSAHAPEVETPVTITFIQAAKGEYPEVRKEVHFSVLPESMEVAPTVPDEPHADLDGVKVSFSERSAPVVNPERGHYRARDIYHAGESLNVSEVKARRMDGYTLWYLGFYLTDFMDGDISEAFLQTIQSSMDALREGGAKCVLRFAYKPYHNDSELMDPEVETVLRHVAQLKPLFQKNEDVIFVLQAGFVGSWGEWYYTSHFGFNPRTDEDYASRRQLTDALLDALPESRQIQLRTPQFKMRMFGWSIKDTITLATSHDGSPRSRLGGHNDCFGASENDYGTFDNETKDRAYWKAETRYTIMGGETCGVSEYCTCAATEKDMKDYHWTYLNRDYHSDVLNGWRASGCYGSLIARLGYRLVMKDLFYSPDFSAGEPCKVTLRFYNTGFASPMNPREAILVWKTPSGSLEETPLGSDPRTWQPGFHTVNSSFVPSTSSGTLYLKLSDPLLRDRPEYSIALANEGVFDESTGLNQLFEIN